MPNPALVVCPPNSWTLVASGITNGILYEFTPNVCMQQTYREEGCAPPTHCNDGFPIFEGPSHKVAYISNSQPIDVYLYACAKEALVRVDT